MGEEFHSGMWNWRGLWCTVGDMSKLEERPDRKGQFRWQLDETVQERMKSEAQQSRDRKRNKPRSRLERTGLRGQEQFPIMKEEPRHENVLRRKWSRCKTAERPSGLQAQCSPDSAIMNSLTRR